MTLINLCIYITATSLVLQSDDKNTQHINIQTQYTSEAFSSEARAYVQIPNTRLTHTQAFYHE